MSPLDPRLPKLLEDWQKDVKQQFDERLKTGTYMKVQTNVQYFKDGKEVNRGDICKTNCKNTKDLNVPVYVDCPKCGSKVDVFGNPSKIHESHHNHTGTHTHSNGV